MPSFKAITKFDRVFEVSIILKAADGALELIGGIIILFIKPEQIIGLTKYLTEHELSQDPHDFIANHLIHSSQLLTASSILFASIYLISHGLIKIILVIEIFRDRLWAYIALIVVTIIFMIYQVYRLTITHSISLALLTIFDGLVVYLTWREFYRQKDKLRETTLLKQG